MPSQNGVCVREQEADQEHGGKQRVIVPVAEQRMRRGKIRQQRRAGRPQRPAAARSAASAPDRAGTSQRSIQPASAGTAIITTAQRHGVDPEIDHEPQMVPGRHYDAGVRAELRAEGKIVLQVEVDEAGRIAAAPRRSGCRTAAARSPACRTAAGSEAARSATAAAAPAAYLRNMNRVATPETRNKQRQPPRIEHQHQGFQRRDPVRALDVKAPGNVEHADVVEDQEPEGADPHPIEVDTPVRGRSTLADVIWFAAAWSDPEMR